MYPHPIQFRVYKHAVAGNKELLFETVPKEYDYMYGVIAYALQNAFRKIDGFIIERVELHETFIAGTYRENVSVLKN